jgi:hypothetical protein
MANDPRNLPQTTERGLQPYQVDLQPVDKRDVQARPSTSGRVPTRFSPGPPSYHAMPISFVPALTIEESHRHLPSQARALLEGAMGSPLAWYAEINNDAYGGHLHTFEYFVLGSGGFGHMEGQLLPGGLWRVNFTRLVADLARGRSHSEIAPGPAAGPVATPPFSVTAALPELQASGLTGLTDGFRGCLGNLPSATQRFLQEPFQHDVVVNSGFRAQRAWTGPWLKEQVWCWIEGRAFFSFAYAHRSVNLPTRSPQGWENIDSNWLAHLPWTVAASAAVLATDACSRTVHDVVG